ncbi:hypothetical protein BOX15_Mlig013140g1 [Macrostomum lignano]|uniref:Uncharacterized protein n=1 Tax=Macrostomum lignano TaxID=282301 RepID=A0A267DYK8_9PLAT|nr:hypothetical protein BOX15_Mlig013140g1 [Macrostomum lignano]
MLNYANLPDQLISGLSTEELHWVSSESATRYVEELSGEFARQLDAEEIQDLSEDALEELKEIEREGIPKSSERQMADAVRR